MQNQQERVPIKVPESSQQTLLADAPLGDIARETAPKVTHQVTLQVLNEAAASEQTSEFKQGRFRSGKSCRSVHVSSIWSSKCRDDYSTEESVSETRRAMPVLKSARLSLPEKKRAAEKVDISATKREGSKDEVQETPELRKSFQSIYTASKSAATIETVSTHETPISERQAKITMEHLHAVHDVEPTRETFGIEQASSFLERNVSHASTSAIKRPVMAAEFTEISAVSKPTPLTVTEKEHVSGSTHSQSVDEATASEITTQFTTEKVDRKSSSRSVHVSASRVSTTGEVLPIEAVTSFKPSLKSEKSYGSVHVSQSRAATVETTIQQESVSKTTRAMPVLESARLSLPEKKQAAEKVDNLLPNEKGANMKQETLELRKSFQSIHTASKSAATIEIVSTHETPITERQAKITMDHLHAVRDIEPTRNTFGIEQASSFLERKASHALFSQIRRPAMAAEFKEIGAVSKPSPLPVNKQEHVSESTHLQPVDEATASEITTQFTTEKVDRKSSSRSVHVSASCVPTTGKVLPIEAVTSSKSSLKSEKSHGSVHVSPSRAATVETTIQQESVSETRRTMPVLESARLSLPEKNRVAEKVDNLLPNEKEAEMKQETPELRKSFQSIHTASKSAATIETVSTHETPITERQSEITMDHLHAVHQIEPTSETFGIEQASSFLERGVSHAIPITNQIILRWLLSSRRLVLFQSQLHFL